MRIQRTLWKSAVVGRIGFGTAVLAMVTAVLAAAIPAGHVWASTPPQPVGWVIEKTNDGKVKAISTSGVRNPASNPTTNTMVGSVTGSDGKYYAPPGGGTWPAWNGGKASPGAPSGSGSDQAAKGSDGKGSGTPSSDVSSAGNGAAASPGVSNSRTNNANGKGTVTPRGSIWTPSTGDSPAKCSGIDEWYYCGSDWKWDCTTSTWWYWNSSKNSWVQKNRTTDWKDSEWWWDASAKTWYYWDGRHWRKGSPLNCSPS